MYRWRSYVGFTLLPIEQNESIEEETDFFREDSKGSALGENICSANGEQSVEDLLFDLSLADVPGKVGMETKDNRDCVCEPPEQKNSGHKELRPGLCDT
jgi:hypothetical protein